MMGSLIPFPKINWTQIHPHLWICIDFKGIVVEVYKEVGLFWECRIRHWESGEIVGRLPFVTPWRTRIQNVLMMMMHPGWTMAKAVSIENVEKTYYAEKMKFREENPGHRSTSLLSPLAQVVKDEL